MTVTPTASTSTLPTSTAAGTGDSMKQLSGNFDTFLTLLTTQLKNQDPTSPMDSNQFTQQLVQFSQVEQQINTNTNLSTLITQGQTQASAMATSYLGKKVTVTNGQAPLAGGAATWNYTLGTAAAATALTVTDANNKIVYSGAGDVTAGAHSFAWDGKDNAGNILNDGNYTLTATSKASDGSTVTTAVSTTGTVNEVDMTSGTPELKIGSLSIGLGDVAQVQ